MSIRLHRYVRLDDRCNTSVFTFLLPPILAQPALDPVHVQQLKADPLTLQRDFTFANHKWMLTVTRNDVSIGVYITLVTSSDNMMVKMDSVFTLLNQIHFTRNESKQLTGLVFLRSNSSTHGERCITQAADLSRRGFFNEHGFISLEIELSNCSSSFEQVVSYLEKDEEGRDKYETGYFVFGEFDWSVQIYPSQSSQYTKTLLNSATNLIRHTNSDKISKIQFELTILIEHNGEREIALCTNGQVEERVDLSGRQSVGHLLHAREAANCPVANNVLVKPIRITLQLTSLSFIDEVDLFPFSVNSKNRVHVYDREGQAWSVESDVSTEHLLIRLYYDDVRNVPRGHLRYVVWSLRLLETDKRNGLDAASLVSPVERDYNLCVLQHRLYAQIDIDEGFLFITRIPINKLLVSGLLDNCEFGQRLKLEIEWVDSQLLFMEKWQISDNANAKQRHQMKRELRLLEGENLALERQLHNYQVAIAKNNTKVE